jgi:hypothetical protein
VKQPKPILHGRDHAPGGSDPIPGLTLGGGGALEDIILAHSPVGLWKLDESSGTTAADSSGFGNDLTVPATFAAPTWAQPAGPPGTAAAKFNLTPTNTRLNVDINHVYVDNFSAGVWVKIPAGATNPHELMGQGRVLHAPNEGWMLFYNGGSYIQVDDPVEFDRWYLFGFTRQAGVSTLYLDGVAQTATTTNTPTGASEDIWVGNCGIADSTLSSAAYQSWAFLTATPLSAGDWAAIAVAAPVFATPDDLSLKVDRDAVEAATNRLVQVKLLAGDTQPAFKITGDGKLAWGQGGTTALDTAIYRSSANVLVTDGSLRAKSNIYAQLGVANQVGIGDTGVGPGVLFGSAADTSLYRQSANLLGTPGKMTAVAYAAREGATIAVASNAVTVTNGFHRITSNPGNANLNTINGGTDGSIVVLTNYTSSTFSIGDTGNILGAGFPRVVPNLASVLLVYSTTNGTWFVLAG